MTTDGAHSFSLLFVCAHAWEARPFLEAGSLKASPHNRLPFPVYENNNIALLLTGSGALRAGMVVSAWLSRYLQGRESSGLLAPTLVVANFGTAGACPQTWDVGQTVLISRARDGLGESLYPERLVSWPGPETECRTVGSPQKDVEPDALKSRPVYDMEAFGISLAVTTFLSSSHLVIGKCVSDQIGAESDTFDIATLKARCENDYQSGALSFFEHAREHQQLLEEDPRRRKAEWIPELVARCLRELQETLPLTVSQQRELSRRLIAHLAGYDDPEHAQQLVNRILTHRPSSKLSDKSERKTIFSRLLDQLHSIEGKPGE